jgi:hypothetical protein
MRKTLSVIGYVLVAFGVIWFFQGIGVLPGSFMSGQPKWAVIGSITALVGVGLALAGRRG